MSHLLNVEQTVEMLPYAQYVERDAHDFSTHQMKWFHVSTNLYKESSAADEYTYFIKSLTQKKWMKIIIQYRSYYTLKPEKMNILLK